MSAEKEGAIICFNTIAAADFFHIPYRLHVVQIILMNFKNIAFGKLDSLSGLLLKEHPYNLINLAFYLHDGYNESDKDNSLNIKTD
ncbi:4561_t:CDS:1, partial [Rhizophagus irregularis]